MLGLFLIYPFPVRLNISTLDSENWSGFATLRVMNNNFSNIFPIIREYVYLKGILSPQDHYLGLQIPIFLVNNRGREEFIGLSVETQVSLETI